MKKIINGKKYDTDTAKLIGSDGNGLAYSDFRWMHEELYRKRTGEYFLFGEGGPMTGYAETSADGWSGSGESIIPLSEEKDRKWAEKHLTADEYEEAFGAVEE